MNDNPANAAVADKKIRSASDNEQLQMFIAAKTNEFREGLFGARLGPELRRTANAQRRVVRQRLVKANLTLFAHNRFQFLGDHEIGGEDLQLFVDVAGAKTQNKVAGLQHISYVAMHQFQMCLITDTAMPVSHYLIDNSLTCDSGNRRLAGGIYICDHNMVGITESAAKFARERFRS